MTSTSTNRTPKTKPISVAADVHDTLDTISFVEGRHVSEIVTPILREALAARAADAEKKLRERLGSRTDEQRS